MKLPTNKECLEKAIRLAVDINEPIIEGYETFPSEYIFYKKHIIELIKFCKTPKTKFDKI
jgi:hypothetical protein